ncbi:hypothetical protein E3N88_42149 [Mikania micrantha]|uniref:Uncharacterized protein n=1 Tax=Mikania micrantha TaxID=192012 RepID=A0A5N6LIJ2_9ASTR|nr:hypothetical protein E3N88_42149 [Mikania micrantha]
MGNIRVYWVGGAETNRKEASTNGDGNTLSSSAALHLRLSLLHLGLRLGINIISSISNVLQMSHPGPAGTDRVFPSGGRFPGRDILNDNQIDQIVCIAHDV